MTYFGSRVARWWKTQFVASRQREPGDGSLKRRAPRPVGRCAQFGKVIEILDWQTDCPLTFEPAERVRERS